MTMTMTRTRTRIGPDITVSDIAAAIGDRARAQMLYSLMDGRARTATELAAIAGITPSTASVHLHRLRSTSLVQSQAQGRHRYYSLGSAQVAGVLEGLGVLAGGRDTFKPSTPSRLRSARTCYDHIAGTLGVAIHDRLLALGWLAFASNGYDATVPGLKGLASLGLDVSGMQAGRRRFAYPCMDWSERRSHLGGALGAAMLTLLERKKWLTGDVDSRALSLTRTGKRELSERLALVC